MINFFAAHHAVTMTISVVALLLAVALGSWTVVQWANRPSRSIRRESAEVVHPAGHLADLFLSGLPDAHVGDAPAVDVPADPVEHVGATAEWSPVAWLDEGSEPDDPSLGTGDVLARRWVAVPPASYPGADGSAPTDDGPLAERLADDDWITRELDAIEARFRTGVDRLMDDVTGDHPWLLGDDEWCVEALGWSPEWLEPDAQRASGLMRFEVLIEGLDGGLWMWRADDLIDLRVPVTA